jgi:hypothetical protein
MAINTIQGYAPSTTEPIDSRIIKANASARLAIATFDAYKGLLVYQQDTSELYVCNNPANPSLEVSWAKIFTSTGSSGSYTGSFSGNGSGLTNVPASGIVGLNLSRTATGSITASVDVNPSGLFTVTSASAQLLNINSTRQVSASNFNIGDPSNGTWSSGLQGSYFQNFDSTSNISNFLRFLAGAFSASFASPTPNSRTFASANASAVNASSTGYPSTAILNGKKLSYGFTSSILLASNFLPALRYGISKGWSAAGVLGNGEGTAPYTSFISSVGYNNYNSTYYTFSSTPSAGSGGNGSSFFTLGRLNTDLPYTVRVVATMSFSNTASISSPNISTGTYSYSASVDFSLSQTSSTPVNGLVMNVITSSNPAVIPNTFQDGNFTTTPVTSVTRSYGSADTSGASISSSGYYRLYDVKVGVNSGSGFSFFTVGEILSQAYLPMANIATSMSVTAPSITAANITATSVTIAPSRSLSGAPYLTEGTSTWTYALTASNIFDPGFNDSTVLSQGASTGTIPSTFTLSSNTVACNTNGVNTAAKVYGQDGTVRTVGQIPTYNDVVRSTATITQTIASAANNVAQSSIGTVNYTLSTTAYAYNNSPQSIDSNRSVAYHQSGSYGQPITSGALAIYGQSQGYDGGTYSLSSGNLVVNFTGESRRLQITDKVLSGSYSAGDAWSTTFGLYNLGTSDLQVKPGYLVKPTGSGGFGYWLNDPDTSGIAANLKKKYAAFGFTRNTTGNQPNVTMTLAGNTSLSAWTVENADTVSILIIPQSVLATVSQASGIDPVAASTTTAIGAGTATNPFGRTLTVLANTNSQKTNPFIVDFPTSPTPFPLNGSYQNFVVLVRYIGNPTPLTSITLAVS